MKRLDNVRMYRADHLLDRLDEERLMARLRSVATQWAWLAVAAVTVAVVEALLLWRALS